MRRKIDTPFDGDWYLERPFVLAYAGLGLGILAACLNFNQENYVPPVRVALIVASLLCAGAAIWWRLGVPREDEFEERAISAILMALASGSLLTGYLALYNSWDSLQLLFMVFWVVALVFSPVLLLPPIGRRIVVSLLVLFHFGGILTATTAVQAHNGQVPWLPTTVWHNIYRPYVNFTYLNNAYHFYSPEPGPPSLVWFQVRFEDDDDDPKTPAPTHWIRLVRREDFPTRQQYQRMLSLTESVNQYVQTQNLPAQKWQQISQRRKSVMIPGNNIRVPKSSQIDLHPDWFEHNQYREPTDLAKRYLASYARYVCNSAKHPDHPDLAVKSVRVYRLTHDLIQAWDLANKKSPTDPDLFYAFYMGEYDPEGKLVLPAWVDPSQQIVWFDFREAGKQPVEYREGPRDPLLYWLMPIYYERWNGREDPNAYAKRRKLLIDRLSEHSGDTIRWEQ